MPEDFAGPRKLRYFTFLLMAVVLLFVLGTILSQFYGYTALETVTRYFVENPMVLFELAGMLSLMVGIGIVVRFVLKHVD
ncbi:hypothetical protein [Haloarcula sp. 1CSR25-25]|jgi:hypothetical protein|uniref:hypothetical protein n=1 Tax=Haloarcula sp. 1CSR25-25 TaxID=2862545 RepID=UPI002896030E|nr:hypothetical protein [Haloarcula sp. 1CSR25-25]MDT3437951.1 hypothetical protein [Haloarcula sp. 1CSR25-25]